MFLSFLGKCVYPLCILPSKCTGVNQLSPLSTRSQYLPLDESRGLFSKHQSLAFSASRPPAHGLRIDDDYFFAAVGDEHGSRTASSRISNFDVEDADRCLVGGEAIQF